MINDWVYDLETMPNVFLAAFEHAEMPIRLAFEISDFRNDSKELLDFLYYLKGNNARLVGFNNIGFDYPVLHTLIKMGRSDAKTLYQKAQAIIGSQDDESRWAHGVKPSDRLIPQLDLFKIMHFDNRSKSTSLKVLEFNMRSDTIQDLPFPFTSTLDQEQIKVLKVYNAHDVNQTKKFLHRILPMIRFREELTVKYKRDFMNHNDTKIGKDFFVMKLEEVGVSCYDYSPDTGRTPRQTKRPVIHLKDAILPWIQFEVADLNRVVDWLRGQSITETKGVFKEVTAKAYGFELVFGTGGLHGSVESQIVESDDEYTLIDLDVSSYYPNLAIMNNFYPAHLGETFVSIYAQLFEQRKMYAKKSAESEMLKLALNGVYGDSNNPYSVFFDPLYTMSITLNGQLLLCLLIENLLKHGIKLVQANTDGITIRCLRSQENKVDEVCTWWQKKTGLALEKTHYKKMAIRDVNSYIAIYEDGSVKRKGAYEHQVEWHQNASALVVPKVAEQVLVYGTPIRETVESWPDKMDFMLRTKVPRSSHLVIETSDEIEIRQEKIQNVSRYYVSPGGGHLFKWMPPLKGKTEWRKIGIESGWGVCVCNDIRDATMPIDYTYYVQEVEKLVLGLS